MGASFTAMAATHAQATVSADLTQRIQAVRRLLPILRFNKTPRVEAGIKRLRRYRRKWNDALMTYTDLH